MDIRNNVKLATNLGNTVIVLGPELDNSTRGFSHSGVIFSHDVAPFDNLTGQLWVERLLDREADNIVAQLKG